MTSSGANSETRWGSRLANWLLACVLLLGAASAARADDCSALPNHTLDGFLTGGVAPSNINIDTNCTIRNFPAPGELTTNFSFFTQPGQTDQRWVVIFDNVNWTGNMSCDAVHEHKIWLTNGSLSTLQPNCQNYLIPVEKIDKSIPSGQTTATIGVPFTYRLKIPVLFDPAGDGTGVVIDDQGSPNELHGITIWDNLNETGAVLSYVSHTATFESTGAPLTQGVDYTFTNVNGLLTFDNFAILPAGEQIIIDLTVVLEDVPA